jgi:hypothetical protein
MSDFLEKFEKLLEREVSVLPLTSLIERTSSLDFDYILKKDILFKVKLFNSLL